MKPPRWLTADRVIKTGFWTQLVLLALVDWGTIHAFSRNEVPWYHYLGFGLVNVVLIALTVVMWRWLRGQKSVSRR